MNSTTIDALRASDVDFN